MTASLAARVCGEGLCRFSWQEKVEAIDLNGLRIGDDIRGTSMTGCGR
jgi:hypothetical protein